MHSPISAKAPLRQPQRASGLTIQSASVMTLPMLIYKIFRADEWASLQAAGETDGAPIDVTDGYIHFSTAETVAQTAAKYFAGVEGLVLLGVAADGLDPLKWEPAREGVLFPHLYRKLRMDDVLWSKPLPLVDGVHQFPDLK